jgi:hypothetical protein
MKTRRDFNEFVSRQQPVPADQPPVDWNRHRDEWVTFLNQLYEQIETFIAAYTQSGQINLGYQDLQLTEEYIGTYTVRKMVLDIGRQRVILEPAGTLLIGSKGRVDVIGSAGRGRILLVDGDARGALRVRIISTDAGNVVPPETPPRPISWQWKIVTNPPQIEFLDLTQETFFDLLMSVVNG